MKEVLHNPPAIIIVYKVLLEKCCQRFNNEHTAKEIAKDKKGSIAVYR
ncbi:hypothetical protein [Sphingobacterium sp. T2]|nr:hypothetical protein [Sphingobacterium sp. T2]